MSENLAIDKTKSDEKIYKQLLPQLESLINSDEPILSSLSNLTAALKYAFQKISWVGFYVMKDEILYLGPFQGKPACTQIKIGSGVCGTSAQKRETIIVDDVDKFPGHIACDAGSKSEIVVPIIYEGKVFAVLDLDSYEYSSFNQTDKKFLEQLVDLIKKKLELQRFEMS